MPYKTGYSDLGLALHGRRRQGPCSRKAQATLVMWGSGFGVWVFCQPAFFRGLGF